MQNKFKDVTKIQNISTSRYILLRGSCRPKRWSGQQYGFDKNSQNIQARNPQSWETNSLY